MSPGTEQLFVYYRVRAADAAAAILAVQAFQWRLPSMMLGLSCCLSRRADDGTELATLMEIYTHAEGISPARRQEIERVARPALAPWVVGERHVEVFVPCA